MTKKKQIPAWYRVYMEKKLARLEIALIWVNKADELLNKGFPTMAKIDLSIAKRILHQKEFNYV